MSKQVNPKEKVPQVQFDESAAVRANKGRKLILQSDNSDKKSAIPYFLEYKQGIQKSLLVEKDPITGISASMELNNNSSNMSNSNLQPQTIIGKVYPTPNKFTTYSKRFPYETPDRATSSQQELRKSLLQCKNIEDIKQIFSSQILSQAKCISSATDTPPQRIQSARKTNNNNNNIFSNQDDKNNKKWIKTGDKFFGVEAVPNKSKDQPLKSAAPNQSPTSHRSLKDIGQPIASPLHKSSQLIPQSPRPPQSPNQVKSPKQQLSPKNVQSKQQKAYLQQKNQFQGNSQLGEIMSNDSFLQNEINKWQLKKISYFRKCNFVQKQIQKRFQTLIDQKTQLLPQEEEIFVNSMKSVDNELVQFEKNSELASKRYQDRLKLCHIRKYKIFEADMKLHTAQLEHKYHQPKIQLVSNNNLDIPSQGGGQQQQQAQNQQSQQQQQQSQQQHQIHKQPLQILQLGSQQQQVRQSQISGFRPKSANDALIIESKLKNPTNSVQFSVQLNHPKDQGSQKKQPNLDLSNKQIQLFHQKQK